MTWTYLYSDRIIIITILVSIITIVVIITVICFVVIIIIIIILLLVAIKVPTSRVTWYALHVTIIVDEEFFWALSPQNASLVRHYLCEFARVSESENLLHSVT